MAQMRTWHGEMMVAAVALGGVAAASGDWREWLAAGAVLATFGHASVAERLREQEAARPVAAVECYRWLGGYYVAKEVLWIAFFVSTGALAALVGCAIFLVYPLWRRWWRSRARFRIVADGRVIHLEHVRFSAPGADDRGAGPDSGGADDRGGSS